jgi:hypothetical protein
MGWYDLKQTPKTYAGAAGTLTFNSGAKILQIIVVGAGGATIALPDGKGGIATIPVPSSSPWILEEHHAQRILQGSGAQLQIVFTSTVSYFVEYMEPAGY